MSLKKSALLIIVTALWSSKIFAQSDDFCDAVNTIMRDAADKFVDIKGKQISSGSDATLWECGIKVPGSVASRFVQSGGLFYEGAVLQTADKSQLAPVYEKYKTMLDKCLLPQHYKLVKQDNFYAGLADYKKLAYMPVVPDDITVQKTPPHVTMEVTYSKDVKKYTVVVYIFEH